MRIFVEGVGLLGPGLNGWQASRPVLSGDEAYVSAPAVVASSNNLVISPATASTNPPATTTTNSPAAAPPVAPQK